MPIILASFKKQTRRSKIPLNVILVFPDYILKLTSFIYIIYIGSALHIAGIII